MKGSLSAVLVISVTILSGCEVANIEDVRETVRQEALDPNAVQFRDHSFSKGGDRACVEANMKNAFGAYTGFTTYGVQKIDTRGKWKVRVSDYEFQQCKSIIENL